MKYCPSCGKSHELDVGRQVIMSTKEVLECRERKGMLLSMSGVFCLATFVSVYMPKNYSTRACFDTESIGASPVIVARKVAKLFKFLQVPSQHKHTIVFHTSQPYSTLSDNTAMKMCPRVLQSNAKLCKTRYKPLIPFYYTLLII